MNSRSKTINLDVFFIKYLFIILSFTVFSLFVFCIIQLNSYTREFYSIGEHEDRLVQLNEEKKSLEINFSKADSLENLTVYAQNQVFEKADKVKYIRVLEGTALAK